MGGIGTNGIVRLADNATPSIVNFTSFGDPVITNNDITFAAHYSTPNGDKQGIFAYGQYYYFAGDPASDAPSLQEAVTQGDIAPDSGGAHFASFLTVADGDFFTAMLDNGQEGLYRFLYNISGGADTTECVITSGDTLDGKVIADIEFSPEGIDNFEDEYDADGAFKVDFTDGSQGVFYFAIGVPEPASLMVPFAVAVFLCRRRSHFVAR